MGMWVGRGRKARAAYGFDDIALVPGALTINPNEVDISWELCGRRFDIPIIAAAMDGVVSPSLAIEMGRLGGLAVINLEGIFSRYENPDAVLDRITSASLQEATKIIQGIYGEPIKEELIHKRISEIKKGGGPVVVSSIPQRAERFADGGAAHHELLGQVALGGKPVAGLEAALGDELLDLPDDLLVDAGGLDGLETRPLGAHGIPAQRAAARPPATARRRATSQPTSMIASARTSRTAHSTGSGTSPSRLWRKWS